MRPKSRGFERIFHDDKWTGCGRSCFIWIQQSGTKRAVRGKINHAPRARKRKRILLYLCPAGESFGAVFRNGADKVAFFIDPNQVVHQWSLSGRGPVKLVYPILASLVKTSRVRLCLDPIDSVKRLLCSILETPGKQMIRPPDQRAKSRVETEPPRPRFTSRANSNFDVSNSGAVIILPSGRTRRAFSGIIFIDNLLRWLSERLDTEYHSVSTGFHTQIGASYEGLSQSNPLSFVRRGRCRDGGSIAGYTPAKRSCG